MTKYQKKKEITKIKKLIEFKFLKSKDVWKANTWKKKLQMKTLLE